VLNVGTGRATTVSALAEAVAAALGAPLERSFGPPRPGDAAHSWADIGVSERLLGYRPQIALADGLRRTAETLIDAPVSSLT
jgi:UDP-glucose 4-epimerase